jgi:WD40 repeat protein
MAELFRYAAFISYSSADAKFAQRLHRALEHYGIPTSLGHFDLLGGGKKNRIYPVFRDREELPAGDLSERIDAALKASNALIVVCSPKAAASPWVEKEIQSFIKLGRKDRIFAIIPDDAPLADEAGADATPRCFPPAFCGDDLTDPNTLEPLAADARKGKDGFRNAWLKLVAGLIGVTPGQLIDRDTKRRRQQRIAMSAVASILLAGGSLGWTAYVTREARSELASYARNVVTRGRGLDAVPFALAGLHAEGDLIGVKGANSDVILRETGAAFQFRDIGDVGASYTLGRNDDLYFSADSRFVATRDSRNAITLRDLHTGRSDEFSASRLAPFAFSPDSALFVFVNSQNEGVLRNLRDGSTTPLGVISSFEFSHDGALLLTYGPNGSGSFYNLQTHARQPLSNLRVIRTNIESPAFSNDGAYAVTISSTGIGTLHDLRRGSADPMGQLAALIPSPWMFRFSRDSRFLVTRTAVGVGALRDLRNGANEGLDSIEEFEFSPSGRYLITESPQREKVLRDLHTGAETPLLPSAELTEDSAEARRFPFGWSFSPGGGYLVTGDQAGLCELRELSSGAVTPLGPCAPFASFSADDSFLFTIQQDGEGTLRNLRDRTETRLDAIISAGFSSFSDDGAFLVVRNGSGGARLLDLQGGQDIQVESLSNFDFSPDSRLLFYTGAGETGFLRDLNTQTIISLGPVGRPIFPPGFAFSDDGRYLATTAGGSSWVLRDLQAPIGTSAPRREICRGSGDAVRPFARSIRLGETENARSLARHLQGRPWNPCDWRGLAAILPDQRRGAGWFEGMRQWWRMMRVRAGAEPDYLCGQINAAGDVSSVRLKACEIQPDDATEQNRSLPPWRRP